MHEGLVAFPGDDKGVPDEQKGKSSPISNVAGQAVAFAGEDQQIEPVGVEGADQLAG